MSASEASTFPREPEIAMEESARENGCVPGCTIRSADGTADEGAAPTTPTNGDVALRTTAVTANRVPDDEVIALTGHANRDPGTKPEHDVTLATPPSDNTGARSTPQLRRVISNLDHMTGKMDELPKIRRTNSFSDLRSKRSDPLQPPAQKVRFFIGVPQSKARPAPTEAEADLSHSPLQETPALNRFRVSSFKNFFRGSSKRKKRKSVDEAPDQDKLDCNSNRKSASTTASVSGGDAGHDAPSAGDHIIVAPGESDDFEADLIDGTLFSKPWVSPFQRSHSTKSRMKPLVEDEDMETRQIARSVTEGNFLYHAPTLILTTISYPDKGALLFQTDGEWGRLSRVDPGPTKHRHGFFNRESRFLRRLKSDGHPAGSGRHSFRRHVVHLLTGIKKSSREDSHYQHRNTFTGLTGHSLASVELGSWAAREGRRGSGLAPFGSPLSPSIASSRTEILQTISSSIIHLFQRKPLKENELGVLQEHVRFLINSEAGGLVQEYYKDQLLRKGMIILREKIKNEQGVELLKQLGETWDYFFKEILPMLQAILYPLTSSLSKDETVRSLTLLAFRNIVVLKVSLKEALDSVSKSDYPVNISQMLLVLQSIQDNVFLSENQFLLEKLVARVVCPYLGQRGVYEGSPDPLIKMKLKPCPFNIPNVIISDIDKLPKKAHVRLDGPISPSPLSPRKGAFQDISGLKKLKPVLEHVYDGGRRHSIMS